MRLGIPIQADANAAGGCSRSSIPPGPRKLIHRRCGQMADGDKHSGLSELVKPIREHAPTSTHADVYYVLIRDRLHSRGHDQCGQFQDETGPFCRPDIGEPRIPIRPRQFRCPIRISSFVLPRFGTPSARRNKRGRSRREIIPTWDNVKSGRDPVMIGCRSSKLPWLARAGERDRGRSV